MKKTLFKNVRKACALMLAIMLLFSCVVNAAPVAQLTAKAEAASTSTVTIVPYGECWYAGGNVTLAADGSYIGWADSNGSSEYVSFSVSGSRAVITFSNDVIITAQIQDSAQSGNLGLTLTSADAGKTYYADATGAISTTSPAYSNIVTIVGQGPLTWGEAYAWVDGVEYAVSTSGETTNGDVSISISGGNLVLSVSSKFFTGANVTVWDPVNGSNAWGWVGGAGTYYVTPESSTGSGGFSTTAPVVSDTDVSDSDVSDSDVSDSDVSDSDVSGSDVSDSDAPQTGSFTIDTSNFSGNVWGSFTDGTGTKQWYNWDDKSVVSQSWAGNICTLLVQAAVQNLTVSVGSLPEVSVELGQHYYSTADGIVTELPTDEDVSDSDVSDSDVSDSDVSDSDVSDSDVSDSDAPQTGSFTIDTSNFSGNVWGSFTDGTGTKQWYNWDDQSVVSQSWAGNICTLLVQAAVQNLTVSVGSLPEVSVEFDEHYYSTADGVVTELPSDDDTSDSDVSDSDVSDSDVPEDLEFVTGSFKINTGAAPGDVWGSYTDENGNTQWYNWGDQSVIAQSWSGYVCTLTVVGKAANITVSCGTMAEIPAQIGGYYFSTSEGVVEGDAPVYNTPTTSTTTEVAEGVDASVVIHYVRADGNYDGWGVGIWGEVAPGVWKDETIMFNTNNDGQGVAELDDKGFDKDGYKVAIISLSEYPVEQLGFKLHQNNWAVEDQWNKDRYIDVSGLEDGDVLNVYIYEGEEKIFYDNFDETLHGKFLAASSGSVLGAFASRSAESTNIGTIAISVICVVLAGAGVAVLAWYMTSNREKEAA